MTYPNPSESRRMIEQAMEPKLSELRTEFDGKITTLTAEIETLKKEIQTLKGRLASG